jgi:hypothetical protein
MVAHIPVNLARCGLRLMVVAAVEPLDSAGTFSTQALRSGGGAGHVARRVQRSGCTRELADGQKRRG